MEILLTKSQILNKIKKHLIEMKNQGNYSLFMSEECMDVFKKDRSLKTWRDFYKLYLGWDNYGFMPIELGKMLEQIVLDPKYILGTHRTFTNCKNEEIYENGMIENILNDGLIISGDRGLGVITNDCINPSKNITPLNNMLNAIINIKGTYKHSDTAFLFAIPSTMVSKDLDLINGMEQQLYDIEILGNDIPKQRLKPKFNLGFVTQDKGICNYFGKDEFLQEYNRNKQL